MPKTKKAKPAAKPKADMHVRCVVAATNASGGPDFYSCIVTTCKSDVADGEHYVVARGMAEDAGFEGPMVVFDEVDGPGWLFAKLFAAPLKKHVADYIRLSDLLEGNEDWIARFQTVFGHNVITVGHLLDELEGQCCLIGADYDYFKAKLVAAGDVAFVRIDE